MHYALRIIYYLCSRIMNHAAMFAQVERRESSMLRRSQTSGYAAMVELVDTRDLKSLGRKAVRVRVPLAAHLFLLFFCSLMLLSCGGKSGYFKLEGRFLHINQGELYVYSSDGGIKGMDTIRIEAGRFAYQTPMERPSTLILVFPNFSQHPVFAEPGGSVDIKADASHLKEMTIRGTDDNDLMSDFRAQIANASPIEEEKAAETFIKDHPGSRVSLYLLQKYFVQVPTIPFTKTLQLIATMEKAKESDVPAVDISRLRQHVTGLKATAKGAMLPSFTTKDIDGNTISNKDLKNGIAVISAWATWSYGSLEIQRTLRDLHKDHDDLHLLSICVDGNIEECKATAERQSMEGTIICDGQMIESNLFRQLGFTTIPDNIILRNGKVVSQGLNNKALKDELNKMLK